MSKIESILNSIDKWCESKVLMLSYEKTKYMIVSKKQNNTIDDNVMLRCNGKNIERVYSFKYLGIHLDSNYCFDVHFESVLPRVSHALGEIGKLRRFMTKRVFVISLESFVNSMVDYGITIWGPSKIKSLPKIQSRISNTLAVFFCPKLRKFYKKSTWKFF
jgi:hypothetical protein